MGKFTNICKLNSIFLNKQGVEEEITSKIRKYFKMNENRNITYQYFWDAEKTVFRGKLTAVNAYIKKKRS